MKPVLTEVQADLVNDDLATAQTIKVMCGHVQAAVLDPVVVATALSIPLPVNATREQVAERVWGWCKRNIRFVPDELQLARLGLGDEREFLTSPSVMVRMSDKQGDCDCFVMSACAFLACLGVPAFVQTFKCDRGDLSRWSHICAAGELEDGSVFPIDASHGKYAGWSVLNDAPFQSQLWNMDGQRVGGSGMGRVRGLGNYGAAPGWTGNPVTSSGPNAGPYSPSIDARAYYQSCRMKDLGAIKAGKFGMGETVIGPSGIPMDVTPSASDDGGGFDWNNLVNVLGKAGTQLGSQALAPGYPQAGYTTYPYKPATSTLGGISTTTLLIGAVIVGGLVFALKK